MLLSKAGKENMMKRDTQIGVTVAGVTVAGVTVVGVTVTGVTVAGVTVAGVTVVGVTIVGVTVAGVTVVALVCFRVSLTIWEFRVQNGYNKKQTKSREILRQNGKPKNRKQTNVKSDAERERKKNYIFVACMKNTFCGRTPLMLQQAFLCCNCLGYRSCW